jgi:hypothetical protein
MLMAQATSKLSRCIPQPSSKSKWQVIERLLERLPAVTLGRVLMWVGGAALLVSSALLMYLVGVMLARLIASVSEAYSSFCVPLFYQALKTAMRAPSGRWGSA